MNVKKTIGIALAVGFAIQLQAQTSGLTQQILRMQTFREGLFLTGTNQPTEAENKELLEVLTHLQEPWWPSGVEQFLSDYPNSPWAASLQYDYACFCRRTGRTTKALEHYEAAWNLAKNDNDFQGRRLSGTILANWMDLLSSLGRLEKLKELIAIGNGWHFLSPADRGMFEGARDSYYLMRDHPGIAFRCGTFALKSVGETLQPTNRALEGLVGIPSPTNGFSMANLVDLSKKYGLNLVAVRRTAGQELIVPSVVHWRQNHYAAILQKQDDEYLVSDPTFGSQKWISADVINEEASGEFLVPAESKPKDWTKLARNQMEKIHGMGLPSSINDANDKACNRSFLGQTQCTHCQQGMPVWWVSEPYINLWLQDEPLSYLTSRGKPFTFQIDYKQRGGWSFPGGSTLILEDTTSCAYPCDGLSLSQMQVTLNLPNGGSVVYPPSSSVVRYDQETRTMFEPVSGLADFTEADAPGSEGFRIVYADGSQGIYHILYSNEAYGDYPYYYCPLERHVDANGDTTWFHPYGVDLLATATILDPDGLTNTLKYSESGELTNIVNPYGLSASFGYDTNENLISITDAQGLTSTITYDTNDWPTALHTPYGTTTFSLEDNGISYDGGALGNAPGDESPLLIDRSALVVDPTGATNLYMYRYDSEDVMPSNSFTSGVPTNTPLGTLDTGAGADAGTNSAVWFRDSFYWGPMQYAHLSTQDMTNFTQNDYLLARMQHWLQDTNEMDVTGYLSVERDPSPDGVNPGLMTFYDYQGKTYTDQEGTNALPSVRAYQLPDGSTHYDYLLFDYFGNITNWISTYTLPNGGVGTRTNQFIYATNTYTYLQGLLENGALTGATTNSYSIPNLLTKVIGADGNPIWSYGGFDTVAWTNMLNVTNSITTNNETILYSSRVLPDYATNGLGQVTTTTYTSSGNPVTWYDQFSVYNGNSILYYTNLTATTYPGWNKVTSVTTAAGLTTTNIYNTNGFLVQTIDEQIGRTNSFGYAANGMIGEWTNELGLNLNLTWDNLLRLTYIYFPDGTFDYIYYNSSHAPLDPYLIYDRMGHLTLYYYDGDRHLTAVTRENFTTTSFDWCGCGALTAFIDALTNVTSLSYNNQGELTNVLYPDGTSLTYQYDSAERMTNVADANGRSLSVAYNNQGLPTSISSANGALESVVYDIMDRPVQVTDANGVTVSNTYDVMNELLSRTWPDGKGETYSYSPAGLIAYENRDNQTTSYGRDTAGRLIAVTNANKEVVQVAWNPSGEIVGLTNGLGRLTSWQYNVYGWLTNKTDALGRDAFQFAYNPDGWLTNRWTPEKGNTAYFYDSVGNLTNIAYPASAIKYAYDADNRLTNMIDLSGTNSFTYTAMGQLASETGPWADDTVSYSYSQMLRTALNLSQPSGSWSQGYSYDSGWRMTGVSSPAGAFGYSYNFQPASFLVSGISLPNGAGIANGYDSLARLTQTILTNHWGHALDGYTYTPDPLGLRTNILRNLGLTSSSVSVGYDNIGQLTSWFAKETNGTPRLNEQLAFGFDSADNLNFRTNDSLSQTFTVDGANELTNVTRNGTFTLSGALPDPATSITVNGQAAQSYGDFTFAAPNLSLANGANTFTIAATNVYGVPTNATIAVNLPQSVNLAYDNNGNLTNDGMRAFGYNTENQLTNVTVAGEWRSDFVYDGLGRRRIVRQYTYLPSSNSYLLTNEVHVIYDGYMPIQERDTNNNVLVTYTRGVDLSDSLQGAGGIGGLLARTDTNGSTFYHSDGAGNITALMDGNEDIVARYMYGPSGKLLGQWGSLGSVNEMEFSSMPHDNLSGLSLYPFRAYEPNLQRFLNEDSIQELGGINLYRAMNNNPLSWIDPFGLQVEGGGEEGEAPGETIDDEINQENEILLSEDQSLPTFAPNEAFESVPQPLPPETPEQWNAGFQNMAQEEENADNQMLPSEPSSPSPAAQVSCPTVVRYTGPEEANIARNSGFIPNVDANGNPKQVYVTPDEIELDTSTVEQAYQIGSQNPNGPTASPTYAILGDASDVTYSYGGNVEGGSGTELTTENQIPVLAVIPLR